jgi:hypothetical protein
MKYIILLLIVLFVLPLSADDDESKYTNVGNIGITITNYGVFGDYFREQNPVDQPSCIYPRGSGIEHMFDGGLWVGANTSTGIHVTTGAFNSASIQTAGAPNYEFTNTDDPTDILTERSSIETAKFFDPEAISHQDIIASFADTNTVVPGTGVPIPQHTPLGLGVHLDTYAWNFPFADAFVILNYTITNVWEDTLKDVYVGLWADLVVRNTNILPPRVGAPFYSDVGVGYVQNSVTQLIYAYEPSPDPGNNYTSANSYVALTFLGADPQADDTSYHKEVFHNWWFFSGGTDPWQQQPTNDAAKYERMRESISNNIYNQIIKGLPGNYMNLITTGPFQRLAPDSSINVVFAIVCAKKFGTGPHTTDNEQTRQNLIENVSWAQRAYYGEDTNRNGILDYAGTDSTEDVTGDGKLNRYILPTPPAPPTLKAIPANGKVTLLWDLTSEKSIDLISKQRDFEGYRVYRSFIGGDLGGGIFDNMRLIHEYDRIDGLFYDTGLESIKMPEPVIEVVGNDTIEYHYRLEIDNLHNGWQYAFAVSAFDSGDAKLNLLSLESSRLQNAVVVSPGTPAQTKTNKLEVGIYPNPYRAKALWDGSRERERKIFFYNLPSNSEVRIYTLAGDMVDSFTHHGDSYNGMDIQWYEQFSDPEKRTIFPGGEHAWDLVTSSDQAIATGLYLFTVKDLNSGDIQRGKFLVIK